MSHDHTDVQQADHAAVEHSQADHSQADHTAADHEHSRLAGPVPALPGNPDLKQLKTRAKELHRSARKQNPADLATIRQHHPKGEALAAAPDRITLRDAQLALARSYGLEGWHALVKAVGSKQVAERDLHRWFGVELNNEVWDLIDDGIGPDSPVEDRELVLYGAYAAARHWHEAGTEANRARGEHLISRAATAVGEPATALRHARRCLELVEAHPDVMADWDVPFAYEALARALAATGGPAAGAEHRATAERLTAALADPEDRKILEGELRRAPWFGLDG